MVRSALLGKPAVAPAVLTETTARTLSTISTISTLRTFALSHFRTFALSHFRTFALFKLFTPFILTGGAVAPGRSGLPT